MQQTLLISAFPLAGDVSCLYEDTTGEILSVTARNWSTRYVLIVTIDPTNGAALKPIEIPPKATAESPTVERTEPLPQRFARHTSVTTFDGMAVLQFDGSISVGVRSA